MASTLGHKLLASLLDSEKGLHEFLTMDLESELFMDNEAEIFDYIEDHVIKFGVMPARATVENELTTTIPTATEPPAYYLDHVEKRHLQRGMKFAMQDAKEILNNNNPHKALDVITDFVLTASLHRNRKQIINYTKEAYDLLTKDYKSHLLLGDEYGLSIGWPTLDDMVGGLQPGDMMAVVGETGIGKTYKMLYMAHHVWKEQKKAPLVVSMEMKPLPLIQRIAAMHHKVPITKLKKAELTTKTWTRFKNDLSQMYNFEVPFWIIDGNLTSTVRDIVLLARQLKPDVVYVDGAYLLQNSGRMNNWERVKYNAEAMKQELAGELGIPVVASYQFTATGSEKKIEDITVNDIGGSVAIGQVATIVLGLFDPETVETLNKKHIRILKGRNGEVGGFDVNWIFDKFPFMDFSETTIKKGGDLAFI